MKRVLAVVGVSALVSTAVAQAPLRIETPTLVWIPGGSFTQGASDEDLAFAAQLCEDELEVEVPPTDDGRCDAGRFLLEAPARRVFVATFGIDRTEVTQRAYRRCVAAGRCAPSALSDRSDLAAPDHPVVGVRWTDAVDYCAFVGGRLPSEDEWEKAARGDDPARRFPWGRSYDSHLASHGRAPALEDDLDGYLRTAPVGAFPAGASPYGLLDLAGNAAEWTSDVPAMPIELGVDLSASRTIRGGSYALPPTDLRVTARRFATTDTAASDVGFRCAYDPS